MHDRLEQPVQNLQVYLESNQIYLMDCYRESSFIAVWLGSKYTSEAVTHPREDMKKIDSVKAKTHHITNHIRQIIKCILKNQTIFEH